MFAAVVCVGLWIGFHAAAPGRPRPDRRRDHGLRRGLRAGARRLHPPPAALVRRPPSGGARTARRRPRAAPPLRRGARTGCWCRSCRRPSGPGRQPPSGSRPSHVPDAPNGSKRANSSSPYHALGPRPPHDVARGAAIGRTRVIASTSRHRLNVPRRPIGQLTDAGDGQQPGRALQLALTPPGRRRGSGATPRRARRRG